MKILIGYDGSECADQALDDLSQAGLPESGVEASVMSIAEYWVPSPPPSSFAIVEAGRNATSAAALQHEFALGSEAAKTEQVFADQARARIHKKFPKWEVETEVSCGSPATELIRAADRWRPDLIVVGSHGHGPIGRLFLGSVSQKVVTEARASVRVARGPVLPGLPPGRILIGIDGSESSKQTVRAVAERNWPPVSEVRLVMAAEPLTPTLIGSLIPPVRRSVDESNREERLSSQRVLDQAADLLQLAEFCVSTVIRDGDPKRVLVEEAERWAADAIFVGATGSGNRLSRFLLGSVSAAVAARAHCSVEVVR